MATVMGGARAFLHAGSYTVLELPSREAALEWAANFARTCRCVQEVRVLV